MSHLSSPPRAGVREWLGLLVLLLPSTLLAIDVTVLFLALPHMAADLGATSTEQLWIMDIYGFLIGGFLITMGTLGDRIGRRKLLLIGAAAFTVASLVAAFAVNPLTLILARAALGIAGATLMPSTLSLIRNMFADPKQRGVAVSIWSAGSMGGMAIGPVVGGIMLDWFWWGSVFLMAVPVMGLLLVVGPFVLPEYRAPGAGRLDLVSVALSLAAMLPIIYVLKDTAKHGIQVSTLAFLLIGLAAGWVFLRRQRILADPMLDLSLFRLPVFRVGLATMLVASMTMGATGLLFAQYLQMVLGMSPGEAGLWSAPSAVASVVGALLAPGLAARWGNQRTMVGGLALGAVGFAIYAQSTADAGPWVAVLGVVVVGLGMAPLIPVMANMVISTAPKERSGSASSMSETSMETGAALGMAVFGSLAAVLYRLNFAGLAPSQTAAADSIATAEVVAADLPSEQAAVLLDAAREAFTGGVTTIAYISAAIVAGLAIVVARYLKERRAPETVEHEQVELVSSADR